MLSTFLLIQRYKFESTNFFGYFIWNAQIVRYTSQESLYPNKEIHMRFTERFPLPTGTCADLNLQYQLPSLCDGKGWGALLTLKQWFLGKVQRWAFSCKNLQRLYTDHPLLSHLHAPTPITAKWPWYLPLFLLCIREEKGMGLLPETERGIPVAHFNDKTVFLRGCISRKRKVVGICVPHNSDYEMTGKKFDSPLI